MQTSGEGTSGLDSERNGSPHSRDWVLRKGFEEEWNRG